MRLKSVTEFAVKIKKAQGRIWRIGLCYVFRCIKLNHRKIVFSNFGGNGYGDNPKYIAEEVIRQNLEYDLVWLLREDMMDKHTVPSRFKIVKENSVRAMFELATSMFWVDNLLKAHYIKKRKNQYYIQTGHGGPSLKKLEEQSYVRDYKRIDLFLSNNFWYTNLVRQRFGYHGDILESGSPRNDVLFQKNSIFSEKVRQHFGIAQGSKIVLYVPTWRNIPNFSVSDIDVDLCLGSLTKRFNGNWIFMIRLHPNDVERGALVSSGCGVIDATGYEDVQELLAVVDAVVTDYSSIMFDFALRQLPVFLYTPDIHEYQRQQGFYFGLQDIPFEFSRNNSELAGAIREFDHDAYTEKLANFFRVIGSFENGVAAESVTSRIKSHILNCQTSRFGRASLFRH